jgi:hypothetical protein
MSPVHYDYIGNALCFPISGREEVGMVVTVDFDELAASYEKLMKTSPYEKMALVLTVLPLKPENVTDKKTHSVKLTNIIES